MITLIGAARWRLTRAVFASVIANSSACSLLRCLKGVYEADALESFVTADLFEIFMLNVHRCDVIGHQHHFVAEKLACIFMGKRARGDSLHDVHNEISCTGKRIENLDVLCRQAGDEMLAEHMLDACDHEIDQWLRRIQCVSAILTEKPWKNRS